MIINTEFFPKKVSTWLLKRKWLWISTKVPFTAWCSMGIDKTVTYHKGYKHFIFRGCVACDKFTDDKEILLRDWFAFDALLNNYYKSTKK